MFDESASWLAYALVLARVLPLGWTLASLTGELIPKAVALSLSLSLTAVLVPLAGAVTRPLGLAGLALGLLRELCIGATFALALSLALLAIAWAVRMAQVRDGQRPVDAFARAYALCAAFLVLSLGGLRAIVIGLAESFQDAGLGGPRLALRSFAFGAVQLVMDAFAAALGFGLPLLLSVWLLEASAALLDRVLWPAAASQVSVARPLWFFAAAALLLVPTASHAPEAVRLAIASARALTRALAR
ncbi:MAG: hypothetical protein JWN48_2808 [Myxococcaceae bacterium]|nr:hypothetical protein [Myxococcaceae bacterium]